MGDFNIDDFVSTLGRGVDAAGVLVIVVGLIVATALFLIRWPPARVPDSYVVYRRRIGRVILLGLEVLVAGDIIRSVGSSPTFRSVGVLAVIVVIRTFLSLELELEIEGRFPWQRQEQPAERQPPARPPAE